MSLFLMATVRSCHSLRDSFGSCSDSGAVIIGVVVDSCASNNTRDEPDWIGATDDPIVLVSDPDIQPTGATISGRTFASLNSMLSDHRPDTSPTTPLGPLTFPTTALYVPEKKPGARQ